MLDASDAGARLSIKTSIQNLNLTEFFLVLSTTGSAFRKCELAWVNGEQIGVRFLAKNPQSKRVSSNTQEDCR